MQKPKKFNKVSIYGLPCTGGKSCVVDFQLDCLTAYAQFAGIVTLVDLCGGGGKIALTASRSPYSDTFTKIRYNEIEPCVCNLLWLLQTETRQKWLFDNLYRVITNSTDLYKLFQEALDYTTMELNIKTKKESALTDKEKEMLLNDSLRKKRSLSGLYGAILVYGSIRGNRKQMADSGIKTGHIPSLGKRFEFCDDRPEHSGRSKERWCPVFSTMMGRVVPGVKNVKITNCDAITFLRRNNKRDDMLVYIDPPYINDGKEATDYKCAWTEETHRELTEICDKSSLKIAICYGEAVQITEGKIYNVIPADGLKCYQDLIKSPKWHRYICQKQQVDSSGYTKGVGGDSSSNAKEIMLCNFEIPGIEPDVVYWKINGHWRKKELL